MPAYDTAMRSETLLAEVRRQLTAAVDPVYREGAQRYFKETIELYGVRAPEIKRIAASVWREWKAWTCAERDAFCKALWQNGLSEEAGIAIYLYRRVGKTCGRREFKLFECWINRYVHNWAHCDGVSGWLLAASIGNEPELIDKLPSWTRSRNRWKRRAAAVSLLQEGKQGRHTDRIFEVASLLLPDHDDMVQKGTGWLLKETYPKKPAAVVAFLEPRKHIPTRTLLRYAAEKMTPADRQRVLG